MHHTIITISHICRVSVGDMQLPPWFILSLKRNELFLDIVCGSLQELSPQSKHYKLIQLYTTYFYVASLSWFLVSVVSTILPLRRKNLCCFDGCRLSQVGWAGENERVRKDRLGESEKMNGWVKLQGDIRRLGLSSLTQHNRTCPASSFFRTGKIQMFPSFASHFPFVKGDGLQNPNFDPLLPCLDLNSHGLQDHNLDPNLDRGNSCPRSAFCHSQQQLPSLFFFSIGWSNDSIMSYAVDIN